jgi:hypothetical protein
MDDLTRRLRAEIPAREPDDAFVARLASVAGLGAAAAASPRPVRRVVRLAVAAAAALLLLSGAAYAAARSGHEEHPPPPRAPAPSHGVGPAAPSTHDDPSTSATVRPAPGTDGRLEDQGEDHADERGDGEVEHSGGDEGTASDDAGSGGGTTGDDGDGTAVQTGTPTTEVPDSGTDGSGQVQDPTNDSGTSGGSSDSVDPGD